MFKYLFIFTFSDEGVLKKYQYVFKMNVQLNQNYISNNFFQRTGVLLVK